MPNGARGEKPTGKKPDERGGPEPLRKFARDRHSNHIADMVRFGFSSTALKMEMASEFKCLVCDKIMDEVTLIFQADMPPGTGVGVKGRVRCGQCGNAARVDIMPEDTKGRLV